MGLVINARLKLVKNITYKRLEEILPTINTRVTGTIYAAVIVSVGSCKFKIYTERGYMTYSGIAPQSILSLLEEYNVRIWRDI